jgi:glycosyltransferase involved in cell wall biosynthesis
MSVADPAEPDLTQDQPIESPTRLVGVLHVINGEHYAGAERVQDLLAQNLGQYGFRAGLACLKPGQFAEMRKAVETPLYDVRMHNRLDLSPAWRLASIVRQDHYQLIHSHTARSALIAAIVSTWTGVPMVHHVHSPAGRDTTHPLRNRLNSLTERFVLRHASALIAVSESLGQHLLRQGFAPGRVFVVPNGVPGRPTVPERAKAKGTWTLGVVALFRPRKGLEILLQSLSALRAKAYPVRLRAVGRFETPEYESQIKQLATRLGLDEAIDWAGFAQNVDEELARMDLFILPSLFGEGMPMVLLEAMSAGLPAVASRVEGVPEAVQDGREGLLVEPGNAKSLTQAIERFLSGDIDWHSIRMHALQRHTECFSQSRMTAGVAEVYRKVLAGVR